MVETNRMPLFKFACGAIILSGSLLTGAAVTHLADPTAPPAALPQAPSPSDHPEFPAGPGRDVTLATCGKCHSPNNILAMRHDRQGWQDLISKMVDLGASGSDEDFAAILDYLTKSFPASSNNHININTATAPQLATALTLTADEAAQIIDYREKNGNFKTLDDLKKVPKVDAKKLEAAKDLIVY